MAALENRNGSWRVIFRYKGQRHVFTIGPVSAADAAVHKAATEELLRLLKRNLLDVPPGCTIEDFMFHRGKPPEVQTAARVAKKELTLAELRDAYLGRQEKRLEPTTLEGLRVFFQHLCRLLGDGQIVSLLGLPDLQRYVDRRSEEWIDPNVFLRRRREKLAHKRYKRNFSKPRAAVVLPPDKPLRHPSPVSIKKEIEALRMAWNWARQHLDLGEEFSGTGLEFSKGEERLPFMTWYEAAARIAAGDDPEKIWECIYLRAAEVAELLQWVRDRPASANGRSMGPWVYPMFVFAAHTGARRSEIVRALPPDVDLVGGVVTIREKKRDRTKLTTRRVPLTPLLKEVLADWMTRRGKGKTLFCKPDGGAVTADGARAAFLRCLWPSKWRVLRGWHVFRHSFISALASKGVDQRIIDDMVGHQTDEQRRRYRHLYPDVKQDAIRSVFGDG
jgi:integrase